MFYTSLFATWTLIRKMISGKWYSSLYCVAVQHSDGLTDLIFDLWFLIFSPFQKALCRQQPGFYFCDATWRNETIVGAVSSAAAKVNEKVSNVAEVSWEYFSIPLVAELWRTFEGTEKETDQEEAVGRSSVLLPPFPLSLSPRQLAR